MEVQPDSTELVAITVKLVFIMCSNIMLLLFLMYKTKQDHAVFKRENK